MKKNRLIIISLLCAVLALSSCDKSGSEADATSSLSDWRNKIEYEGSFYVSRDIKLLYALDTGTITLWDNKGNGDILQTLKYETTEKDAIERLENKDINADGNNDILVVYSDDGANIRYNLWLWNTAENKYSFCSVYKTIYNPVVADDGKSVTGSLSTDVFGTVKVNYIIKDDLTLELISSELENADAIAEGICSAILPGSTVHLSDGQAKVQEQDCTVYVACENEKDTAYIAYTKNANWYIDTGCVGAYRLVTAENGMFTAGTYVDDAGKAVELCGDLFGRDNGTIIITETIKGSIDNNPARKYIMTRGDEELCTLIRCDNGFWYYVAPDSRIICNLTSAGTAEIKDETTLRFVQN